MRFRVASLLIPFGLLGVIASAQDHLEPGNSGVFTPVIGTRSRSTLRTSAKFCWRARHPTIMPG